MGDVGLIPGLGRSPGEGKGYPLQDSDLENSQDYSPWGLEESDTTERLSKKKKLCDNSSVTREEAEYSCLHGQINNI